MPRTEPRLLKSNRELEEGWSNQRARHYIYPPHPHRYYLLRFFLTFFVLVFLFIPPFINFAVSNAIPPDAWRDAIRIANRLTSSTLDSLYNTKMQLSRALEDDPFVQDYWWCVETHDRLKRLIDRLAETKARMEMMEEVYRRKGVSRHKWPEESRIKYSNWMLDLVDDVRLYEDLSSRYNNKMQQHSGAYSDRSRLPKGATQVLPERFEGLDNV